MMLKWGVVVNAASYCLIELRFKLVATDLKVADSCDGRSKISCENAGRQFLSELQNIKYWLQVENFVL